MSECSLAAFSTQLTAHDRQLGVHDVRMAEMDLRFQLLETASYDGTLVWKIRDYERRKRDAVSGRTLSLYSQPFYSSRFGYKMCARVYLNGDGMGKTTHMSLFFVIMRGRSYQRHVRVFDTIQKLGFFIFLLALPVNLGAYLLSSFQFISTLWNYSEKCIAQFCYN